MEKIKKNSTDYTTMNVVEKRLAILVGAKFVDRSRVSKVAEEMEKIRKRLTTKAKGFNATAEIRKWRDARCKY